MSSSRARRSSRACAPTWTARRSARRSSSRASSSTSWSRALRTLSAVNVIDVLLLLGVAAFSILGAHRGLAAQALSLGGLALGAVLGSIIAPYLLSDNSPWIPVAGLMGALVGAFVLSAVASMLGAPVRLFISTHPPLATVDRIGGIALGALIALGIAWLIGVLALHQPALGLRGEVRASAILPRLLSAVPPDRVLQALNRFDPL